MAHAVLLVLGSVFLWLGGFYAGEKLGYTRGHDAGTQECIELWKATEGGEGP